MAEKKKSKKEAKSSYGGKIPLTCLKDEKSLSNKKAPRRRNFVKYKIEFIGFGCKKCFSHIDYFFRAADVWPPAR